MDKGNTWSFRLNSQQLDSDMGKLQLLAKRRPICNEVECVLYACILHFTPNV